MKNSKKFLIILILIFSMQLFFACSYFETDFIINNYNDFLNNQTDLNNNDDGNNQNDILLPKEYTEITNKKFEYAGVFFGEYAYVEVHKKPFIIDKKGNLFASKNLWKKQVKYDKFLTEQNGRIGLESADGQILLENKFKNIKFNVNTILTYDDENYFIYKNNQLLNSCKVTDYKSIELFGEDLLILNNQDLYDFNFVLQTIGEYTIKSYLTDDRQLIYKNMNFGYANTNKEIVITPQFYIANDFVNGYAIVKDKLLKSSIIDKTGKVIFFNNDYSNIYNYYDNYFCFKQNNNMGVMDNNFQVIIPPIFFDIYRNRVFNKFLITSNKFFDIEKNQFVGEIYEKITFSNDHFIAQKDNNFTLLNNNLEIIIENCDNISIDYDVLFIEKSDNYKYFNLN